ncbi:amidase [Burkholderia thailandensis]|nr:amidase [Burkholderia thailandensis]AVR10146.1 amidase [Burkholderia thailandensis]AWY57140.1 amidase [Burkholderia thailandensis]AWY68702.1 amidase [Burkholderia thailandensis]KVG16495.1 amidase [Burkholderia thailandensis]
MPKRSCRRARNAGSCRAPAHVRRAFDACPMHVRCGTDAGLMRGPAAGAANDAVRRGARAIEACAGDSPSIARCIAMIASLS